MEALSHTNSVESATEWLLTHSVSNEDDELLRAISMSLQGAEDDGADDNNAAAGGEESADQVSLLLLLIQVNFIFTLINNSIYKFQLQKQPKPI